MSHSEPVKPELLLEVIEKWLAESDGSNTDRSAAASEELFTHAPRKDTVQRGFHGGEGRVLPAGLIQGRRAPSPHQRWGFAAGRT